VNIVDVLAGKYTNQEVYDFVIAKLRAQGVPATEPVSGACRLRAGSRKCAIGWLIPDDQYKSTMEEFGAGSLVRRFFGFTDDDSTSSVVTLLESLQKLHDQWYDELLKQMYDFRVLDRGSPESYDVILERRARVFCFYNHINYTPPQRDITT